MEKSSRFDAQFLCESCLNEHQCKLVSFGRTVNVLSYTFLRYFKLKLFSLLCLSCRSEQGLNCYPLSAVIGPFTITFSKTNTCYICMANALLVRSKSSIWCVSILLTTKPTVSADLGLQERSITRASQWPSMQTKPASIQRWAKSTT